MKHETLIQLNNALCARLEEILPGVSGLIFSFESGGSSPEPMDEVDLACARNEHELSMRIHQHNRRLFKEIMAAIARIRKGEFGICEECGSEIEIGRLQVLPTATVCIECKRSLEALVRLKAA